MIVGQIVRWSSSARPSRSSSKFNSPPPSQSSRLTAHSLRSQPSAWARATLFFPQIFTQSAKRFSWAKRDFGAWPDDSTMSGEPGCRKISASGSTEPEPLTTIRRFCLAKPPRSRREAAARPPRDRAHTRALQELVSDLHELSTSHCAGAGAGAAGCEGEGAGHGTHLEEGQNTLRRLLGAGGADGVRRPFTHMWSTNVHWFIPEDERAATFGLFRQVSPTPPQLIARRNDADWACAYVTAMRNHSHSREQPSAPSARCRGLALDWSSTTASAATRL